MNESLTVRPDALARREIATVVVETQEADIVAFALGLPAERIPGTVLRVSELRRALLYLETRLEMRIAEEQLVGEEGWTDPDTHDVYDFTGSASWEVSDPEGLRSELLLANVPKHRVDAAMQRVWKVSHIVLNSLRDHSATAADAIREFRIRKYGPRHLVKRESIRGR